MFETWTSRHPERAKILARFSKAVLIDYIICRWSQNLLHGTNRELEALHDCKLEIEIEHHSRSMNELQEKMKPERMDLSAYLKICDLWDKHSKAYERASKKRFERARTGI